ncbi:MAG: carboxy-S-adenosyl-L-methionine synthase CmoA [bacterium]
MRDTLFNKVLPEDYHFQFDNEVARVFDDMLKRSIPYYQEIQRITVELAKYYYQESSVIYDIGCSTGNTLIRLAHAFRHNKIHIIGIDSSGSMIAQAREKLAHRHSMPMIELLEKDCVEMEFKRSSVVIMLFTLQFIPPCLREKLLSKIYSTLHTDGIFILSEKIISSSQDLNILYSKLYQDFKRKNDYSELEIKQKSLTLQNVLIPYTVEQNSALLKNAGFKKSDIFFKWNNFISFCAMKTG